ncbi:MAG TPA: hypothetical protein VGI40_02070 [Pirellulaceae bacterium]|jgi:hypothetical protein
MSLVIGHAGLMIRHSRIWGGARDDFADQGGCNRDELSAGD